MSQRTEFYVTPSTSTYLVKQLSTQTVLYLSTNNNSFTFNVRDITGLSTIQQTPAIISTIGGASFIDGTTSYYLNQPLGFVNISLRNSNLWQVIHTSGQTPATSAANIQNLNVSTTNISLLSSYKALASTVFISDFFTAEVYMNGPFRLVNLSVALQTSFASSLNVSHNVFANSNILVNREIVVNDSLTTGQLYLNPNNVNTNLTIFSSLYVKGNLFVGNYIQVLSTLVVQSTVQMANLQIQKSTGTVLTLLSSYNGYGSISTLLNVETSDSINVYIGPTQISKELSSLEGIFSTPNLIAQKDAFITKNISTYADARFYSTVHFQDNLSILNNFSINSTFVTISSFYTTSLSTSYLSSASDMYVNGNNAIYSTFFITKNLSTTSLFINQLFSTQNGMIVPGFVSTYQTAVFHSTASVLHSSILGSFYISDFLVMGGNTRVFSTLTASSIDIRGSLDVKNNAEITDQALFQKSTGVGLDAFVSTDANVREGFFVSTYRVQSFILSNLEIMTSSPFVTFTTSSLAGSIAYIQNSKILGLANNILSVPTVYASTLQTKTANFTNYLTNDFAGAGFQLGTFNTAFISDPSFAVTEKTLFAKGFSTPYINLNTASADRFSSINFVGDGRFLSNYPFPYSTISGTTAIASTILVSSLVSRGFTTLGTSRISSFYIVSSLLTDVFRIDGIGYPPLSTVNQMLMLSPTSMALNNTVYFNRQSNYVGIGISSPIYDLDVSGTLYAQAIVYSTLSGPLNSNATVYFSSISPNFTDVRDALEVGTQGLNIFYRGTSLYPSTFRIFPSTTLAQARQKQVQANREPQLFSLIDRSTITISFNLFVDSQKHVGIGADPTNSDVDLSVSFTNASSNDVGLFTSIHASSIHTQNTLLFSRMVMPNFILFSTLETPAPSTNMISTTDTTVFLNYPILSVKKTTGIGILQTTPQAAVDVMGNAYFSSFSASNVYANEIFFSNFQTI